MPSRIANYSGIFGNPDERAIFPAQLVFKGLDRAVFFHHALEFDARLRIRVEIFANVMNCGEHFRGRTVAAHARQRRIHAQQPAIHGRLKNSFHRVLEQQAESFLGFLLRAFRFAPVGNVLVNSVAADDRCHPAAAARR